MSNPSIIQFFSSDKKLKIYKIPVFTIKSYKELKDKRGTTYVLDLFIEVCRENQCHFLGLSSEHGYIHALLGFNHKGRYEERTSSAAEFKWSDHACK
ncbi:MAG: hypothetical protein NTZ10_05105 [Candidatus Saganbacteria bacterium]|nr:hypothetical protein [Candidatus Saganbacteria bacterium]